MKENQEFKENLWEEKNSIELLTKSENKTESKQNDSMINTETVNEQENWQNITDPKLRKQIQQKAWRLLNKARLKAKKKKHYIDNKKQYNETAKLYRENNKEKIKLQKQLYRQNNREKILAKKKAYRLANKDKYNSYRNNRLKNDPQFKLGIILRSRLRMALNKKYKSGSAVNDLGCSISELQVYLESKFQPGMTWNNHGEWHIDHIKPLAAFDLSDRKQLLEACHYTNLQPLWAKDNLSKNKYYYDK